MPRPPSIIDTNVVVAGLLTTRDESPVAHVLDAMLNAVFPFVVSEALLAEYRTVLLRPKLQKLHRLPVEALESILTELAQHAIVLAPVAAPPAPDSEDQSLWGLLAARHDLLLVTGDKRLLSDHGTHGRVISPAEFLSMP